MADTVAQPPDAEIFDEEALQSITVQNETLPARATNNEPSNTKTSGKTNTTTSAAADGYNTLKELAIDILFCVLCTAIVVLYYLLFDHTLNLSPVSFFV